MLSHTVTLWSVTEIEFEFFCGIFSTFKCSYFCFCMCWPLGANTWMWDICIRVTSAVCNSILSHWNLPIIRQQRQLPKWNILSLLCMSKQLDRIFHFVRECLSWKTIPYIQTERKWAFRHSIQGQYEQRTSKETWHSVSWKTFQVLLPKLSCFKGPFTCTIKAEASNMCVAGSDKLLRGNQIDWVIKRVSWFQVFCKEIKSNAVSKLFILVWHYEGMKVLDLGYENSYENFSITPVCHIFSNFPAVFHHTQVMKRQVLKHRFTQLQRSVHI